MNDQKIAIPVDLFNALVNYLVERPFKEVAGLVNAMGQIQQQMQSAQAAQPDAPNA